MTFLTLQISREHGLEDPLPAYLAERRITRTRWRGNRDIDDVRYHYSLDVQQLDDRWLCNVVFSFASPPNDQMRIDYRTFVQKHALVEYNTVPLTLQTIDQQLRRVGARDGPRSSSILRPGPWEYLPREPLPDWRFRARQSGARMSDETMASLVRSVHLAHPFERSGSLTIEYHR